MPRQTRALPQRQALGRRIRAHRLALGLTSRDVAAHIGTSHSRMTSLECATQDGYVGTLIDVADALGLDVALVAEHHLPLLDLTAAEIQAIAVNVAGWLQLGDDPTLRSALTKLTPPPAHDIA